MARVSAKAKNALSRRAALLEEPHQRVVLRPRVGATDLVLEDTRLLFYYQNRLAAHGLAFDALKPKNKPS